MISGSTVQIRRSSPMPQLIRVQIVDPQEAASSCELLPELVHVEVEDLVVLVWTLVCQLVENGTNPHPLFAVQGNAVVEDTYFVWLLVVEISNHYRKPLVLGTSFLHGRHYVPLPQI